MDSAIGVLLASVRRRTRSMGARCFLGALLAALALAILLPSGGGAGASVALESALAVIGVGAAWAAAASAGALPEDRASGVRGWLVATACPRPILHAAPAIAGVLAALVVALAGSGVAGALLAARGLVVPTRRTSPLGVVVGSESAPLVSSIEEIRGAGAGRALVELDVRPRYRAPEAAGTGSVRLRVEGLPDEGAPSIPVRGRVEVSLPTGVRTSLSSLDPDVDVRVVAARRVEGPSSFLANVLRSGLLLGLALASIAPIGVLLSRFLSAPTAVAAALALTVIGVLCGPLSVLARDAREVEGGAIAAAILSGATWLAPDLSVVAQVSESVEGRRLGPDGFAGLVSPALHALFAFLVLVGLPARRSDA